MIRDADDPYVVFVHGFNTQGGAIGKEHPVRLDRDRFRRKHDDHGAGQRSARADRAGQPWSGAGLLTGPGEKQVGAVSHSDPTGIAGVTVVNIENDAGSGFCDLVACAVSRPL